MIITATFGQNIIDLAIQHYGCYEGVFEIIKLNPQMGLSHELQPGDEVTVHDVIPQLTTNNVAIAAEFALNNVRINSSYIPVPATTDFYADSFFGTFYN